MVVGTFGLAKELFVDGESAFICPNDSPPCMSEKVNRFLNENTLRIKLVENMVDIVFGRIEQDYPTYMESYRNSIERCLPQDS